MNSQYYRLINLAEELDTPPTPKKIEELNELLAATDAADVKPEHLSLLDDLISIMANTGNLTETHKAAILDLSDKIRVRKLA
jgi:hypothetical protein